MQRLHRSSLALFRLLLVARAQVIDLAADFDPATDTLRATLPAGKWMPMLYRSTLIKRWAASCARLARAWVALFQL